MRHALLFAVGLSVGAAGMLGGLMALAAWLARDAHTDPDPGRVE